MAFITPNTWTRLQGYPQVEGNKDGTSLVDKFFTTYDLTAILASIPVINSLYDGEAVSPELATLHFSTYSIEPSDNKNHAMITFTYQPLSAGGGGSGGIDTVVPEFFLENSTLEKPLEFHPDYLTTWNYHLCKLSGTSQGQPAGSGTATTTKLSETEWRWVKEPSELETNWVIEVNKTKPGVESYIIPSPAVQEKSYFSDAISANEAGATVGTILAPAELFGITGGKWLVMSASVQLEGRAYLLQRSFQYAETWDTDLY